jgi:hypothetical protein
MTEELKKKIMDRVRKTRHHNSGGTLRLRQNLALQANSRRIFQTGIKIFKLETLFPTKSRF